MNWNYWLPWRKVEQGDKDLNNGLQVIEGEGEGHVIVSEEQYEEPPNHVTD